MTEQEAIKYINYIIDRMPYEPPEDFDYRDRANWYLEDKNIRESLEMSMSALDKQIPKKPKHQGFYDNEGVWHEWNGINGRPYELCPNCETNLCCEMPYDKKPKYCKDCGQKLDWSDK